MKKNISAGLKNWNKNKLPKTGFILISFFLSSFLNAHADSSGKDLFNQNCMICHADDGGGAMPGVPDLTENKSWSMLPEKKLLAFLIKGSQKPGAAVNMPPKGGNQNLTDKDLLSIISYMRKEFLK